MNKNLTEQLFNTIIQLRRLILQKAYESAEEKMATMLQFSALNFLQDHSNLPIGDLAGSLQLSKSSTTQLIGRLSKNGLIQRISDKSDKRIIRLHLTGKGEKELVVLRTRIMNKMNRFLLKIPTKDLQELIRIHSDLIKNLKKDQ